MSVYRTIGPLVLWFLFIAFEKKKKKKKKKKNKKKKTFLCKFKISQVSQIKVPFSIVPIISM